MVTFPFMLSVVLAGIDLRKFRLKLVANVRNRDKGIRNYKPHGIKFDAGNKVGSNRICEPGKSAECSRHKHIVPLRAQHRNYPSCLFHSRNGNFFVVTSVRQISGYKAVKNGIANTQSQENEQNEFPTEWNTVKT